MSSKPARIQGLHANKMLLDDLVGGDTVATEPFKDEADPILRALDAAAPRRLPSSEIPYYWTEVLKNQFDHTLSWEKLSTKVRMGVTE